MDILEQIIEHKKTEVRIRKSLRSRDELEKSNFFSRDCLSLKTCLQKKAGMGIITEFKRRSPSKGIINDTSDVVKVTSGYTYYGASALSILTDEKFFEGKDDDIVKARVNKIPILRKDFIIDEYQVTEAKSIGADVILLIAACLTKKQVKSLSVFAKNLGLEVLLELHNEEELDYVCTETDLIGVNNRNLKTFEVTMEQSISMGEKIPGDKIKIAESGINSVQEIALLKQSGFDGFLIGELFMRSHDPAMAFAEFVNALQGKLPGAGRV